MSTDTIKKLFKYFLMFVAFYVISTILQDGIINDMYVSIDGDCIENGIVYAEVKDARATKVNGYMVFDITNNSGKTVNDQYAKIVFNDEYGHRSITEYAKIKSLDAGQSYNYKVNFRGENIKSYNISFVSENEIPDKSNIINILGWEFDATNLFGLGINLKDVYGVDVTQYLSVEGMMRASREGWKWGIGVATSVPTWAYVIAAGIVLWYI